MVGCLEVSNCNFTYKPDYIGVLFVTGKVWICGELRRVGWKPRVFAVRTVGEKILLCLVQSDPRQAHKRAYVSQYQNGQAEFRANIVIGPRKIQTPRQVSLPAWPPYSEWEMLAALRAS